MEDDGLVLSSFTSSQGTNSASTAAGTSSTRTKSSSLRRRRPGVRTIRRIADWVVQAPTRRALSMKRLGRDSSTFL